MGDLIWDEKLKLCLSDDVAQRALVIFKFSIVRSASGSDGSTTETDAPIAMAALNLSKDGFFIRDGEHRLKIRRLESGVSFEHQLAIYLAEDTAAPVVSDPVLCIDTFLCSTRITEDNTLHSLLHWKKDIGTLVTDESRSMIKEILRKFTFVPEIEILKVPYASQFR